MGSGGAEKVISLILPELSKKYDVSLVLLYNDIHYNIPEGVEVVVLNDSKGSNIFRKVLDFPLSIISYLSYISKHKSETSISFLTRPNLINGFLKIRYPHIKVIMSERRFPSLTYNTSRIRLLTFKSLIRLLYNKADIVFSNSIEINRDLKDTFSVHVPMKVIYNPVKLQPKTSFNPEEPFRIINVGSMFPQKNQLLLLTALKGIDNVELTILGHGPLREQLEQESLELQLKSRVKFKGIVKNVNNYLDKNDCFILSSNSEGFPNALLEAMAIGLPVISTNCFSGPLEMLNNNEEIYIKQGDFYKGKYGLLTKVGDIEGMVKAINYFKMNPSDRKRYSDLAYERAKEYSIERFINDFSEMLDS